MRVKSHKVVAIAAAIALAVVGSAATSTSANAAGTALKGVNVIVGSKDFTESIVLSKIVKQFIIAHGGKVTDKTNIKGSSTTREAMVSGDINMYWEYTGTAWLVYQKQTDVNISPADLYKKVVAGDKKNKVTWLPMTSFNDTYAWAITKANATKYGIKTYSDLAKKLPAGSSWCVESEFQSRPDGWAGFKTKYGISDSNITTKVLDTGAIYQATKDGQCMVGEVFATDGRIGALGLMVPQEDISYFPPYNAALTMTDATAKKYPQLVKALAPIAAKISNATMQNLNARVDVLGEDADTVAKSFLTASGLVK
ncbi:OpuBC Periplasmic glycine betaine/choline-binding (lipo)protein of an ABC-type transport system (osmoprotectant binding protein) [Candidatus Nanopelagicaceae bacterium]